MSEPKLQGQHRISEIYLKQFGYKEKDKWMLSVYELGKEFTTNVPIKSFTKETNIFDLPIDDIEERRHFEKKSSLVESRYPEVINSLKNKQCLPKIGNDLLCHYVSNLMCRTVPFRNFIGALLNESETRDKFINEMTMFAEKDSGIREVLSLLEIDDQVNVAIGTLMDHMVRVLRTFKQVILRGHEGKFWMTTDNPVVVDRQGVYDWIVPIEAEIYFPLSRDFCLFMYHEESEIQLNPLRKLEPNNIHEVDFSTYESINKKVVENLYQYLITPIKMERTDVTGGVK